jgi:hypothetical protein
VQDVIKAAEAYFPMLMGLIQILNMPTTRLVKPLPFTWTSPVSHKDPKSFCTLTDYNYELVMIMHLLADAHMNRAAELIARATEQVQLECIPMRALTERFNRSMTNRPKRRWKS